MALTLRSLNSVACLDAERSSDIFWNALYRGQLHVELFDLANFFSKYQCYLRHHVNRSPLSHLYGGINSSVKTCEQPRIWACTRHPVTVNNEDEL